MNQARLIYILLFFWVFITFAYFQQTRPDWNVNSRMSLTFAIVDKQTFIIDNYQKMDILNSGGDRALYEGNYYSDKVIGTSLLGTIPYSLIVLFSKITGTFVAIKTKMYLVTVFTSSLLAAFSAVLMLAIIRRMGGDLVPALILTAGYAFGTLAAGYATLFYSYSPALFFSLLSFYFVVPCSDKDDALDLKTIIFSGLSLGAMILCEYVFGIIAIGLSIYTFFRLQQKWHILIYWSCSFIPLSFFLIYTFVCFGEFSIPYKYLESDLFREGMAEGFMGIKKFQLPVLWYITFHPYRGIFFLSPQILLSIAGLFLMFKNPEKRLLASMISFFLISYLLFNTSYYMWWGGWTYGPRHLIPMIPFLIFPLLEIWKINRIWKIFILISIVYAIGINMLAVSVGPNYPQGYSHQDLITPYWGMGLKSPLLINSLKHFLNGAIQTNWGNLFGLTGVRSVLPLLILWAIFLAGFFFAHKKHPP